MAGEVAKGILDIEVRVGDSIRTIRQLSTEVNAFQLSLNSASQKQADFTRKYVTAVKDIANSTGVFTAQTVKIATAAQVMDKTLSKGQATLAQFFSAKFNKNGAIAAEVLGLARERVSALNTQVIATQKSINGFQEVLKINKLSEFSSASEISAQKQQILSQMLKQGTTNLINFGKNVQWAGRQLMVGFTVPLTIFGNVAGKTFMDLEKQLVAFKKVYGDIFTTPAELSTNLKAVTELGREYTKYGIAVKDTIGLAAQAAAAGRKNADLTDAVAQATRLATLGQMDQNAALETTISLQSAFRLSGKDLADTINFLNMVENQTVVSLQDLAAAIPRVAPVVQGLGGDVKDLAVFLAAMQEGGVDAAEGANALKSGLASLINPTKQATQMLSGMGINLQAIIDANKGDLMGTVMSFSQALASLDQFSRQQALEQVFGKFQYAKLGALFDNITRQGSQAQQVIATMGYSTEQLGATAEKELKTIEQSFGVQLTGAIERFKLAIAPIGEIFVKNAIPIVNMFAKLAENFNNLSEGKKQFIAIATVIVGVVIPAGTMLLGLFMNLTGTITKFTHSFASFAKSILTGNIKKAFQDLAGGSKYLSLTEIDAAVAAQQLSQASEAVSRSFQRQASETDLVTVATNRLAAAIAGLRLAQMREASSNPEIYSIATQSSNAAKNIKTGGAGFRRLRRNSGGPIVPGVGNTDTVPAMLTPGEFVINKEATAKNFDLLNQINSGKTLGYNKGGMIPGVQYFGGKKPGGVVEATDLDKYLEDMGYSQISRNVSSQNQRSHILDQEYFIESLRSSGYNIPSETKHAITSGWYGQVSVLPREINEMFSIFSSSRNVNWTPDEAALIRRGYPVDQDEAKMALNMMNKVSPNSSSYIPAQRKLSEYARGISRPIDDILSGMQMETSNNYSQEMIDRIRRNPKSLQQELTAHIIDGIENKDVELYGLKSGASASMRSLEQRINNPYVGTKQALGKIPAIGSKAQVSKYLKDLGRLIPKVGVRANKGLYLLKSLFSTRGGLPSGRARRSLNETLLSYSRMLGTKQIDGINIGAPMSRPDKAGNLFLPGRSVQRGHVASSVNIGDNKSYHPGLMIFQGAEANMGLKGGVSGYDLAQDFRGIEKSGLHPASLMLAGIKDQGFPVTRKLTKKVKKAYEKLISELESNPDVIYSNDEYLRMAEPIFRNTLPKEVFNALYGVGTIRSPQGGSIGTGVLGPEGIKQVHGKILKSVQKRNAGGIIWSPQGNIVPGSGNTDTVPAMLTPGEFVVNKESTAKNLDLLHSINNGKVAGYNRGGLLSKAAMAGNLVGTAGMFTGNVPMMLAGYLPQIMQMFTGQGRFGVAKRAASITKAGGGSSLDAVQIALKALVPKISSVALKFAGIGGAIATLGIGFYNLNKKLAEQEKAGGKLIEAMYGSADRVKSMGDAFGRESRAASAMRVAVEKAGGQFVSQEAQQASSQFIQSDAGKKMIEDVKLLQKEGKNAIEGIRNQLAMSIIAGVITTEEARAIAIDLGKELKDQKLAVGISAELTNLVGPDGKDILKNLSNITAEISPKLNKNDLTKQAEEAYKEMNFVEKFGQALMRGGKTGYLESTIVEQVSKANQAAFEAQAQALATLNAAYQEGSIKSKEFLDQQKQVQSSTKKSVDLNAQVLGYSSVEQMLGVAGQTKQVAETKTSYGYIQPTDTTYIPGSGAVTTTPSTQPVDPRVEKFVQQQKTKVREMLTENGNLTEETVNKMMTEFEKLDSTGWYKLASGEWSNNLDVVLRLTTQGKTTEEISALMEDLSVLQSIPGIETLININAPDMELADKLVKDYQKFEEMDNIEKNAYIKTNFKEAGLEKFGIEYQKILDMPDSAVKTAMMLKVNAVIDLQATLDSFNINRVGGDGEGQIANDMIAKIKKQIESIKNLFNLDPTPGTGGSGSGGGAATDWEKNLQNRFDIVDKRLSMEARKFQDVIDLQNRQNELDQRNIDQNKRALDQLTKQEDAINKTYDARIDALDNVTKANDRLKQQEQSRISLATALASGDIAGAASTMSEMSATQTANQIEDARAALELQREEDLKNLKVEINGQLFTREEINLRIDAIEENIYQRNLKIRDAQDSIYQLEQQRLANSRERERVETRLYLLEQQKAITSLEAMKASKKGGMGLDAGQTAALEGFKKSFNEMVGLYNSTYGESIPQAKMYGGKIRKMAFGGMMYRGANEPPPALKMAFGSIVPGLGNTDRVPALLTPGEFVVRKSVAQANMPLLEMLNNGVSGPRYTVPQSDFGVKQSSVQNTGIVYNDTYSINVNVSGTNASPDEIANVVINKLSQFKSANVRGIRS